MKSLTYWITQHPFKTTIYLVYYLTVALLTGFDLMPWLAFAGLYAAGLSFWISTSWKEMVKVTSILLAVILAIQALPARPQEPEFHDAAGGVAVGVIVVVVGGVAVVYLVKTCRRLFDKPPKTNDTESVSLNLGSSAGDSYAGSWTYSSYGSCYVPPQFRAASTPTVETVLRLDGELRLGTSGPELALIPMKPDPNGLIGVQEFSRLILEHGIPGIDGQLGSQYFAKNGQPVSQDQTPIAFDAEQKSVSIAESSDYYVVIIERSFDLINWEKITTMKMNLGNRVRFDDSTVSTQAFYRARPI